MLEEFFRCRISPTIKPLLNSFRSSRRRNQFKQRREQGEESTATGGKGREARDNERIYVYIPVKVYIRVIASRYRRPSRFWTKWVVLLERTVGEGPTADSAAAFSLMLVSVDRHSTSASIVFRESRRGRFSLT